MLSTKQKWAVIQVLAYALILWRVEHTSSQNIQVSLNNEFNVGLLKMWPNLFNKKGCFWADLLVAKQKRPTARYEHFTFFIRQFIIEKHEHFVTVKNELNLEIIGTEGCHDTHVLYKLM